MGGCVGGVGVEREVGAACEFVVSWMWVICF